MEPIEIIFTSLAFLAVVLSITALVESKKKGSSKMTPFFNRLKEKREKSHFVMDMFLKSQIELMNDEPNYPTESHLCRHINNSMCNSQELLNKIDNHLFIHDVEKHACSPEDFNLYKDVVSLVPKERRESFINYMKQDLEGLSIRIHLIRISSWKNTYTVA